MSTRTSATRSMVVVLPALLLGCTGTIDEGTAGPGGAAGTGPGATEARGSGGALGEPDALGPRGIQRLTREELGNTVRDLLGLDLGSDLELLPEDALTPFDNDYTTQLASTAMVEALKAIADRAAERALADTETRDALVGCAPAGPGDTECLRAFIERFGRRALRRPLREEEVDAYAAAFEPFAVEQDDFYVAVSMVIRALLQDVEFIYRMEVGEPVAGTEGLYRLSDWEVASRLSYLLWGSGPDEPLLDRAAAGELKTGAQVRSAAARMLDDPRATGRLQRFHAMWLGYERLPHGAELAEAMRRESDALVRQVIVEERRSWLDLFTAPETYVDAMLAEHYGLEAPEGGGPAWVPYGDDDRRGILSHGSFLSGGANFGDTSPTLRGILVRERLLCEEIPSPPPEVDTDEPPEAVSEDACKLEKYEAHSAGGCASCHSKIDPIGFGLERWDEQGRYRTHEPDRPECPLPEEGEVEGLGTFGSPAELGSLLAESGGLGPCLARQLYRFTVGREERPEDREAIERLAEQFRKDGHRLRELLLELVSSEAFRYRVVDASAGEE